MLVVCVPIGFFFANMANTPIPLWAILAAVVATISERFEFGPIDDNILITTTTMVILVAGAWIQKRALW
jgi:hypothetical protein